MQDTGRLLQIMPLKLSSKRVVAKHNLYKIVENTIKGADCTSIKIIKKAILI